MKDKSLWAIFWAVTAVFVILIGVTFIPSSAGWLVIVLLVIYIALVGLGAALLVLTIRKKMTGKLRNFLLLTGSAAAGFPIAAVLHNLVSALFNTEEPVFFVIATIACPIGFLVGFVGIIILTIKSRAQETGQNV